MHMDVFDSPVANHPRVKLSYECCRTSHHDEILLARRSPVILVIQSERVALSKLIYHETQQQKHTNHFMQEDMYRVSTRLDGS